MGVLGIFGGVSLGRGVVVVVCGVGGRGGGVVEGMVCGLESVGEGADLAR